LTEGFFFLLPNNNNKRKMAISFSGWYFLKYMYIAIAFSVRLLFEDDVINDPQKLI
jgi:hypothetical protein